MLYLIILMKFIMCCGLVVIDGFNEVLLVKVVEVKLLGINWIWVDIMVVWVNVFYLIDLGLLVKVMCWIVVIGKWI